MKRAPLFLSGLVLLGIGIAILFAPHAFHAMHDITLPADPSLLSEVRAPGGALIAIGALVLLGAFRPQHTRASAALGAATYLAYGASRGVSLLLDRVPHEGLIQAMGVEFPLGVGCLVVAARSGGMTHRATSSGGVPSAWPSA